MPWYIHYIHSCDFCIRYNQHLKLTSTGTVHICILHDKEALPWNQTHISQTVTLNSVKCTGVTLLSIVIRWALLREQCYLSPACGLLSSSASPSRRLVQCPWTGFRLHFISSQWALFFSGLKTILLDLGWDHCWVDYLQGVLYKTTVIITLLMCAIIKIFPCMT